MSHLRIVPTDPGEQKRGPRRAEPEEQAPPCPATLDLFGNEEPPTRPTLVREK